MYVFGGNQMDPWLSVDMNQTNVVFPCFIFVFSFLHYEFFVCLFFNTRVVWILKILKVRDMTEILLNVKCYCLRRVWYRWLLVCERISCNKLEIASGLSSNAKKKKGSKCHRLWLVLAITTRWRCCTVRDHCSYISWELQRELCPSQLGWKQGWSLEVDAWQQNSLVSFRWGWNSSSPQTAFV